MRILLSIYLLLAGIVPSGQSYLKQLQPRDSILIADQLEYGVEITEVEEGTRFSFQDYASVMKDTLTLVRNWQIDTLKTLKNSGNPQYHLRASVVIAPFEEGSYKLPEIAIQRTMDGRTDTLLFDAMEFEAKTIPIDTATFQMHDIKGQIRYPVTFAEVLPYILAVLLLALLSFLAVRLIRAARRRRGAEEVSQDPPYIVALRRLEHLRGDKYWAPDKQKFLYSGITDTIRTYIESRFDINAEEMTTAEIFAALKGRVPEDLYAEIKSLFETADFVKFAKMTVGDEQNAGAVPVAVRFVTATYQAETQEEKAEEGVQ